MKFDTVIIGGGLSGLICGIKLTEQGKTCAIVSSGQSALHFFSGSFDLLGQLNGEEVSNPIEAISKLPSTHPYQKLGAENTSQLAEEIPLLLDRAGLRFSGNAHKNHFVLTPMGTMKPTWLTIEDFTRFEQPSGFPWKKASILNFSGFLDFHTQFIQQELSQHGVNSQIHNVSMTQLDSIRRNPSEMRSTNIAKVFDRGEALSEFATELGDLCQECEVIIMPAVFGLFNRKVATELKGKVGKPIVLIPVIPPSVPGIRSQIQLRDRFKALGGTYFLGDNVEAGNFRQNLLTGITTTNHGDIQLEADHFVLATGSFFSKGIIASPEKLYEPVFGLDIEGDSDRLQWTDSQIYNDQPFMHYGVRTDNQFRPSKNGNTVENLYAAGSILSGANSLKEGSGAGISLLTSLQVAEKILEQQ